MSEHQTKSIQSPTAVPAAAVSKMPAQEQVQNEPAQRSFYNSLMQFKLAVGAADDPLEHEADAMADTIMRMPEQNFIQRKCAHCEEEEKLQRKPLASFIQRKETSSAAVASDAITDQINSSRGSGSNIDRPTQSFMETRFGADFSNVKIHTGNEAVQMNRDLNAKAFTVGSDIYFNEGQYNPSSNDGKHLLAHELTHTVQQGAVRENTIQRFTCRQILNAEEQQVDRGFGVKAHQVITRDFKSQFPSRAKGFRIPGAISVPVREGCGDTTDTYIPPSEFIDGPEPRTNRGIPDLAYIDDNRVAHLAEIKIGTWGCREMAENQVARYVQQGNMDDQEMVRYRSSPHMRQSLRGMGLTGPLQGFTLMDPAQVGYTIPQSVIVDGINTQVAGCGNGVIVYKNIGGESDDRHLCNQSPDRFIDRLIAPAERMIDEYIDTIANPAINQLLDTLSLEEMITLAYENARPAIRDAVVSNFGSVVWEAIAALDDETAVRNLARLLEHAADANTRAVLNQMVRRVKEIVIVQIRQAMRRMLRGFIQQLMQQLCEGSAAVSMAMALQAISRSIGMLFRRAVNQMIEQAVLIAAAALVVVAVVAIILAVIAVVVVIVAIVLLLPEILAALGIGTGVAAAGGAGTLAAGSTGAVIAEGTILGSGVTSTGVTLTLLQGGAGVGTATTVVASGTGGGGTIAAAAAAVLLFFGIGGHTDATTH